jgi:hypothetical protein
VSGISLDVVADAIVAKLRADTGAGGAATLATGGIHDEVPEGTEGEYVVVGASDSDGPFNTFGRNGHEASVTIDVVSKPSLNANTVVRGFKKARALMSRIVALLEPSGALVVSGHQTVLVQHTNIATFTEPEGDVRRVVGRFQVITQDT